MNLDWNRRGKIKAGLLILLSLPSLFYPQNYAQGISAPMDLISLPIIFIFVSLAIPLISKFNNKILGREIVMPHWNDKIFSFSHPLNMFHFGTYFFITQGLSVLLGSAIAFQHFSSKSILLIVFGLGIRTGIHLAIKWVSKKKKNEKN